MGSSWTRLPNVSPLQISRAKQVRKLLTGNLDAPVHAHPPFPGKEADLLRAQIARIVCAAVIAPSGYYSVAEPEEDDDEEAAKKRIPEGPKLQAVEDFEGVGSEELKGLESWVHAHKYLMNSQSRCHKWTKPAVQSSIFSSFSVLITLLAEGR